MRYKGIMTALVTPLDKNGSVDEQGLKRIIQDQLQNGIHSLLVLGGTGEYCALSMAQRKQVIDIAMKEVDGKVPVVVGLLSPGLGDCVELGLYAKQAGADSVMVVTPYYVRPTKEGFIQYFKKLDQALDMPIMLYNIPYKTGIDMGNDVVQALVAEIPNIVSMKVCSHDIGDVIELMNTVGDKISVLCGEDYRAVSSFILGAPGAITASSNFLPDVWVKIYDLVQQKQYDEAVSLHKKFFPAMKALYKEGNPGPLKAALNLINLPVGDVAVPLVSPSESTVEGLKIVIKELSIPKR
ncbi:4-hydroxy-tetrahydrodipicolinate synthase [Brevibacillus sp. B_LB10_24]|uniref:4-hydroxy-tetrahydrodipicolinate synthase n=1 Tax=Brevibacillus sp. B_LB10_24 TaxID=3380645 RepID=UPI0038B925F4